MSTWFRKILTKFHLTNRLMPFELVIRQEIKDARDKVPIINNEVALCVATYRMLLHSTLRTLSQENIEVNELFQKRDGLAYRWKLLFIQSEAAVLLRDFFVNQLQNFTAQCMEYLSTHRYSDHWSQAFIQKYQEEISTKLWKLYPDPEKLFRTLSGLIDKAIHKEDPQQVNDFFNGLQIPEKDFLKIIKYLNFSATELFTLVEQNIHNTPRSPEAKQIQSKHPVDRALPAQPKEPPTNEGKLVEEINTLNKAEGKVDMDDNQVNKAKRNLVFISYSRKDARWLEMLKTHLRPFERAGTINRWDDTKIEPGQIWKEEIEKAIGLAKVVVLLVSADFLASDFIANDELPPLLQAAESEGATILSVIIKPCSYLQTENISRYQAINPPNKPLAKMSVADRDKVLSELSSRIVETLKNA